MRDTSGKVLRIVAIILMALTAAMNIIGGAGTSCAAFATAKYPPFRSILDYAWLYQGFVITSVLTGMAGVWATYALLRGKSKAYRNTLIVLVVGSLIAAAHFIASTTLRGAATPANVKMYINLFTLAVFLLLGLPGMKERVNFEGNDGGGKQAAAGLAALVVGLVTLATPMWAGPSHTFDGINLSLAFPVALLLPGALLTLGGLGILCWTVIRSVPVNSVLRSESGVAH